MADDGVTGALKERLSSEVLGTFSLSMIICCWKVWIFAFNGQDPEVKIRKIEEFLYSWQVIQALGEALAATLFILFAVKWLKTKYSIWAIKQEAEVKVASQRLAFKSEIESRDLISSIEGVSSISDQLTKSGSLIEEYAEKLISHHAQATLQFYPELVNNYNFIRNELSKIEGCNDAVKKLEVVSARLSIPLKKITQ